MSDIADRLFQRFPAVRYVALLQGKDLALHARPSLKDASAAETDRFEELWVNPAVLNLLQRRGDLDCGGLDHLWIRYGSFWTGLFPIPGGHLNVGLEPDAVPADFEAGIRGAMKEAGLA